GVMMMEFGLDATTLQLCAQARGRIAGCPTHMSVANYRELLHQLPHSAEPEQVKGAALYVTAVIVFYVALLMLLIGGGLRRRRSRTPNAPAGRRHILAYNPSKGTALPTLAEHHPQPVHGAQEV
ncbi:unnamed protein product, partial [Meganyctiphanes norvegica]